jgi:hypothetical protein
MGLSECRFQQAVKKQTQTLQQIFQLLPEMGLINSVHLQNTSLAPLFRICSKITRRFATPFLRISSFAPFHNGDDICFYSDVKAINLVIARLEMNVTERCGQKQNDIERGRTAAKNEKTYYCLLNFYEAV